MTSRIPPILYPYVQLPPESSLTLVTSVLGASANWVLFRFLSSALGSDDQGRRGQSVDVGIGEGKDKYPLGLGVGASGDVAVILLSWMREWEFWRLEARKAVGLDLTQLQQKGRLVFIDGLSHLFTPPLPSQPPTKDYETDRLTAKSARSSSPASIGLMPLAQAQIPPCPLKITSSSLTDIQKTVMAAISSLTANQSERKILLVLDVPSLLLHTTSSPISAVDLTNLILRLRSLAYATIISLPADKPLLRAASSDEEPGGNVGRFTPLERENAEFCVNMAYAARLVIACRRLGTGWAEDVSGVLRVTCGGHTRFADDDDFEDEENGGRTQVEEGEWLYHNSGDGTVKVWSRGGS